MKYIDNIIRNKSDGNYTYSFRCEDIIINIFQGGNGDVYFCFYNRSGDSEIILDKNKIDPLVIKVFDQFFNDVIDNARNGYMPIKKYNSEINKDEIILISDEWNEEKEFNELYIKRFDSGFKFSYKYSNEFFIAFNTDRGHNRFISVRFLKLLRDLNLAYYHYQVEFGDEKYFCLSKKLTD